MRSDRGPGELWQRSIRSRSASSCFTITSKFAMRGIVAFWWSFITSVIWPDSYSEFQVAFMVSALTTLWTNIEYDMRTCAANPSYWHLSDFLGYEQFRLLHAVQHGTVWSCGFQLHHCTGCAAPYNRWSRRTQNKETGAALRRAGFFYRYSQGAVISCVVGDFQASHSRTGNLASRSFMRCDAQSLNAKTPVYVRQFALIDSWDTWFLPVPAFKSRQRRTQIIDSTRMKNVKRGMSHIRSLMLYPIELRGRELEL